MTGWRVGWMIVPEDHVRQVERLSQNLFISSGNISQYSALKAFDCFDYFNKIVDEYRENKIQIFKELKNVKNLAATNVDRISVGELTHSIQALDLKLEI